VAILRTCSALGPPLISNVRARRYAHYRCRPGRVERICSVGGFLRGAEILEGRYGARILVGYFARRWKARTIKVYVGGLWFGFVFLLLLWEVST